VSFDEFAQTWDTSRRILRAKEIADEISKTLSLEIEDTTKYTAMEFGCGTGLVSFNLHNHFNKIYLLDSSKEMIKVLESKIEKYEVNNMFSYHSDEKLIDEKVDIIYTSMVLHHIQDIKETVCKFYEILNEDGFLIIIDLNKEDGSFHKNEKNFNGHNGFDQDLFKTILEEAGFRDINVHTFYNNVKVIDDEEIDYSLFLLKGKK